MSHATAAQSQLQPSFWGSVWESLQGSHQDFTVGNLNRAILLLAIPMVLEMALESFFAVVDVFWVSHLGANAVATVGFTESLLTLVFAVALGLSLSTTAMVARRIGEKDKDGASVAAVQSVAIGLMLSCLMGVPCLFYAPLLLRLMGASPEIVAVAGNYARIALGACGPVLLRVSVTGILEFAIAHASWIGLVRIVSMFGSAALAGYTIAIRIVIFAILPSWGLSNAAATLVGQNLGAKQPDRAETSVWRTGFYNMLFLGGVGVFFILFAEPIVRLFTHDPAVVPLGTSCLRILSYGNVGYAYGMVMLQAFNGAGDTVTPTIVNLFGFWLLEIPLAWWLALRAGFASNGVFFSIVIAEAAIAVAGVLLFRRGRWKLQKI